MPPQQFQRLLDLFGHGLDFGTHMHSPFDAGAEPLGALLQDDLYCTLHSMSNGGVVKNRAERRSVKPTAYGWSCRTKRRAKPFDDLTASCRDCSRLKSFEDNSPIARHGKLAG